MTDLLASAVHERSPCAAPLVSCLMPTRDRRRFVPRAVACFLAQDYPNRELVVVDDGDDPVEDLLPAADPRVRYVRLDAPLLTGTKRNRTCALARGDLLAHWDDDDWSAPRRLSCQVERLLASDADLCGLSRLYFFDPRRDKAWTYVYPSGGRPWVAGGTLLFRRAFWERHPFPDVRVASDTVFVWNGAARILALDDPSLYVATVHAGNTSPKRTGAARWQPLGVGVIRSVLGDDWPAFAEPERAPAVPLAVPVYPPETIPAGAAPETAILMVTHNTLDVVRLAVLRTLRHSAGARLVVVDNASTDGTRAWLRLMAARGDLDLVEADANLGHGPALELGRARTAAPVLVTLDSDAFPLTDDWLGRLRQRLDAGAAVAGILHHRGYVHPSCLMVRRETLDRHGLTFLNEKDRPSRFDVAERISVDLKARGLAISGLERTDALRRGSASEPVYLGSSYEDLVYHQWYTTRTVAAGGRPIDDVPPDAAAQALRDLLDAYHAEPRDVTVVVGVRAGPDAPQRRRNLEATLRALALQDIDRWRYRVVVVEQDDEPRLREATAPLTDRYLFVRNGGPYNRGWAFNVGAVRAAHPSDALLCLDADLLVPPDFVRRGLGALAAGAHVVLPYREVVYLTESATVRVLNDVDGGALAPDGDDGRVFTSSQGGALWVTGALYREAGGHEERFEGWGCEDREVLERLARRAAVERLPVRLLHLHHPQASWTDVPARANRALREQLRREPPQREPDLAHAEIGRTDRYATGSDVVPEDAPAPGQRDWEHWHTWTAARVERIVRDERRRSPRRSHRQHLASRLEALGGTLLDVGCGPGALWTRLDRGVLAVTGLDASLNMVAAARRLFPGIPAVHGDASSLPFDDDAFDTVVLRHLAEHLPDALLEGVLAEATRVARHAVVVDHFLSPLYDAEATLARVGEGFLEVRRPERAFTETLRRQGWAVTERSTWRSAAGERDEVWIVRPEACALPSAPAAAALTVSIIMPTYRRPHTLARTVRQVLAQTYPAWELIVVDNAGSVDPKAFEDPRVRVVCHSERPSASYARNQGLAHATGDLVCFFDDDDDMFADHLARFVAAFEARPRAGLVRSGTVVSDGTVNFTFATPQCCLRRTDATPTWEGRGSGQDQRYYQAIVSRNRWSDADGTIVTIPQATCRANTDGQGGLREGHH